MVPREFLSRECSVNLLTITLGVQGIKIPDPSEPVAHHDDPPLKHVGTIVSQKRRRRLRGPKAIPFCFRSKAPSRDLVAFSRTHFPRFTL